MSAFVIVGVTALAYWHGWGAAFVFDSIGRLEQNPAIERVWPPGGWLTFDRRPVAYFTFAVNHALGGNDPRGYFAVNLAIHVAAALALFSIVFRTLSRRRLAERYARSAGGVAFAAALLWAVHPLQSQAVTYHVQRIEALAGLFILLTLSSFQRAQQSRRRNEWYALSIACCALGVATKETAAMAPILVLAYDRIFVASSWSELWRTRCGYYAALCSTYALLGFLMVTRWETYSSKVGAAIGLSPAEYLLNQTAVIAHYLRLCYWPAGQCVDYDWPVAESALALVPAAALMLILLASGVVLLMRSPPVGFLLLWFFVLLAPTSSIVPIADLAFEHRMYLPSAAVVLGTVLAVQPLLAALSRRLSGSTIPGGLASAALLLAATGLLAATTFHRNTVYAGELAFWSDVVEKAPHNARGHYNLADALRKSGDFSGAKRHLQLAIDADPNYALAHNNLGLLFAQEGNLAAAKECYLKAIESDARCAVAYNNLGIVCRELQEPIEAIKCYLRASTLDPSSGEPRRNLTRLLADEDIAARKDYLLGIALVELGDAAQGRKHLEAALRRNADLPDAHYALGVSWKGSDSRRALRHFREVLRLKPDSWEAHTHMASLLSEAAPAAALEHLQLALKSAPQAAQAHNNLANLLVRLGKFPQAAEHYRQAVKLEPDNQVARKNLAALERRLQFGAGQMEFP